MDTAYCHLVIIIIIIDRLLIIQLIRDLFIYYMLYSTQLPEHLSYLAKILYTLFIASKNVISSNREARTAITS